MTGMLMFVGALTVAYLVPGPDMVLLLRTGAAQGRAQALAAAAGLAAARAAHVALAGLGLATLLRTAPAAFEIVRFAGAAYLIWLGIGILRAPSLLPDDRPPSRASGAAGYVASFRRGLLTNLLNPKALLFCSVLLPQFVQPGQGVLVQFLLLGLVLVGVGAAFDLTLALAGAALGRWLARHRLAQTIQQWTFGTLLIAFGARLSLASVP